MQSDPDADAYANAQLYEVDASRFVEHDAYAPREECFGPVALVIHYDSPDELRDALLASEPALTFSPAAIERWLRPVTFQSVPDGLLAVLAGKQSTRDSTSRRRVLHSEH